MNKLYNLFRWRIIFLCMFFLFAIIVVVHLTLYITTKNIIENQLGLSSQSVAVAVAGNVAENIDEYKLFVETRDVNSDYYRRMQKYFAQIKAASNIKYVYTERKIDNETVEFILDAEPIGSSDYSPPGQTTFMDLASRAVYSTGNPARLQMIEHPVYGILIGACAPIIDKNGEIIGAAGVNIDASEMVDHMRKLQFAMIIVYIIIMILVFLLLKNYSGVILEPLLKDKLTGAYNKRYCDKLIEEEIVDALKNQTELALMMLDLDHFKKVNDTYGHSFGDVVLAEIAKTIRRCLRETDCFFRYGGEEFVVLIAKTSPKNTAQITERIRSEIEKLNIFNKEKNITIKITISIGLAYLDNLKMTGNDLLENADKALYNAKITRNTVSVFEN